MVSVKKLWTPSNRFAELAEVYRSVLEILDRIDGQLTTRTDDDTGVVTVISDSNAGHGITTASTVDVYWQSGQRIGMSVTAVTNKAVTVDGGAGDALPTLNDYVWVKVQGAGGTIFPLGDHIHGALTGLTLTTIGEQQVVVTASEAWNAWDKPAGRFVGILPYTHFNGDDEGATTPDIDYLSFGDGSNDSPFSVGALVRVEDTGAGTVVLSKWTTGAREWSFTVSNNNRLQLRLADEDKDVTPLADTTSSVTDEVWKFVADTYDGRGGATAADGIEGYVDGAVDTNNQANEATYVAMENGTRTPQIGYEFSDAGRFKGGMAILFIVPRELTADNLAMLDHIIRGAAGLT